MCKYFHVHATNIYTKEALSFSALFGCKCELPGEEPHVIHSLPMTHWRKVGLWCSWHLYHTCQPCDWNHCWAQNGSNRFWGGGLGGVLSTFKHWFLSNRMRNWMKNCNVYILMDRAHDTSLVWFPFNLHLLHMTVRWLVLNASQLWWLPQGDTCSVRTQYTHSHLLHTCLQVTGVVTASFSCYITYNDNSHWIARSVYISNNFLQWNSLAGSYICLHLKPAVTMR